MKYPQIISCADVLNAMCIWYHTCSTQTHVLIITLMWLLCFYKYQSKRVTMATVVRSALATEQANCPKPHTGSPNYKF